MTVFVNQLKCTGCAFCLPVCQNLAITSFGVAEIDVKRCVSCLECLDFCPSAAIGEEKIKKENHEP